jgi:predicted dehydrogenase
MSKEKPVRVGILGCGAIAQLHHIPSFLRIKEAEIVAICDKDETLLNRVGGKIKTAKRYKDFSQMLSQEKLDLVDICTPPQTHAALSVQAAEAGCHILVEKPAALSVEEFDKVAEACVRNNVKLCQVQHMTFEPVIIDTLSLVKRKGIGDVVSVDIKMLSRAAAEKVRNPQHWCHRLPAGIFTEVLPHHIYLTQAFLGAVEPVAVHIRDSQYQGRAVSDEIRVILEGKSGVGTLVYSGASHKDKVIIDVHGTKKNLRIDLWNSARFEYNVGSPSLAWRALENLGQSLSVAACTVNVALSVLTGRFHGGHFTLIQRFVRSIRDGTEAPVSMEQAREVIRVLEGITQMAKTRVKA